MNRTEYGSQIAFDLNGDVPVEAIRVAAAEIGVDVEIDVEHALVEVNIIAGSDSAARARVNTFMAALSRSLKGYEELTF